MAYTPIQQNSGLFIQQTPSFDITQLYEVEINSEAFRELIVRLYQQVNNISIALNNKVSGYNLLEEFVTGKQYFPATGNNPLNTRPSSIKMVYLTNLPAGVTATNHGIAVDANTSFVDIYGVANDTVGFNYYPLPFASAGGANNIELRANNTQVIITNNSGIVFNKVYIFLEFLKS